MILFVGCSEKKVKEEEKIWEIPTLGNIERLDPEIDRFIPLDAEIEILATGFEWSEGPVWIKNGNFLLFSDIPPNSIFKWSESDSIRLYLKPSGYTGGQNRDGEPGSNGLLLDPRGRLVLCQHGDRRMAVMNAPLESPVADYSTLADRYEGKRLNSPNDAVYHSNGDLYFTDPPYGLEKNVDDPAKEMDFQGVFLLRKNGDLILLTDELSRPNGIGLSPDEKTLYVANSDPEKAIWMAYSLNADGTLGEGKLFSDVTSLVGREKGLPDGLKVHGSGILFATGPGGVLVFNPDGKHLGTIKTTEATANCAFDDTGSNLYITADMHLLRVRLRNDE
ncbi:MAG: SMP-30/gluconolactonase/LRE family protein [Cyclobacteriaceae bacterium]|nr:SMP-30/gluconolactonase/LRE family protein [Cyclobacteriaceae bacterium]